MVSKFFYHFFKDKLLVPHEASIYLNLITNLVVIGIFGYILFKLLRFFGKKFLGKMAYKTKTSFDDLLIKNKVFRNISRIIILSMFNSSLHILLEDLPFLYRYFEKVVSIAIILFTVWLIRSILLSIKDFLREFSSFKDKPLESYVQIFMVILWMIAIIIAFSVLTDKSLYRFLTALGTFSAILLLIFKDTILGFVASIQITINDTVRLNDWITMEKYSTDGSVIEINLASVIVKNFDNTVTSIPTYSLISDSFKNWRAMNNSKGRRIKRSVLIKVNSIKFVEDLSSFNKIELLKPYITNSLKEINRYNTEKKIDKSLLINGRNLTNLGLFRKYLDEYLKQHPKINQELLFMTRQLESTPNGIPLEVYAFSKDKTWVNYERITADIFDHIFASISYFDLEAFELPTGNDLNHLNK